jgi:hypothetical protein
MDTRFEQNRGKQRLISEGQRDALFAWLLENRDNPKFIVTATPFVTETTTKDDWPRFRDRGNFGVAVRVQIRRRQPSRTSREHCEADTARPFWEQR